MRTFRQTRLLLRVFAVITTVFCCTLILPMIVSVAYGDGQFRSFFYAFLSGLVTSGLMWLVGREPGASHFNLRPRDAIPLVVSCWSFLPVIACIPFLVFFGKEQPNFHFTVAYFEAVSGLTTTGATTLSGLDQLPESINFWRLFLQWLGGMGILILAVAVIPLLGFGGSQLFRSEATGPLKDSKVTPRITETAKGLWLVYLGLSIACFISYWIAGMPVFDALIHSFSTLSLGGLSSHDASFGHFESASIQWTAIVFMLLASCNFSLYFVAFYRRTAFGLFRDQELRLTLYILIGSTLLMYLFLLGRGVFSPGEESFRTVMFNVVSIASTTGYATTDYTAWPLLVPFCMILMSSFATSAGSTGAGIKVIRLLVLVQQIRKELKTLIHPKLVDPVRISGSPIGDKAVFSIVVFIAIYCVTALVITVLFIATGLSIDTAWSATFATLNNMGPGLNEIGPSGNYSSFTSVQLWIASVAMILGRIELLSFFVMLSGAFWRA